MAARWFDADVVVYREGAVERREVTGGGAVWLPSSAGGHVDVAPLDPFPRRSVIGFLWRVMHWRTG